MQDTATQAMTEVALGLSMAFFALLILALISVTLSDESVASKSQDSLRVSLEDSLELQVAHMPDQITQSTDISAAVFMFFYEGEWFNSDIQKLNTQQIKNFLAKVNRAEPEKSPLTVVVSRESSFEELLFIQQSLAPYPVQLAEMSEDWRQALAQSGGQ